MSLRIIAVALLAGLVLCVGEPTWAGARGEANRVTVRPREIDDILYNPGMGFTTSNSFDGEVAGYPKSTIAYWGWYWDKIEPENGVYRWELIDEVIEKARARGQRVAIRIMPANGRGGVPQWYRDLGAKGFEYASEAGPTNWMPDHNDPLYVEYMGRLVREFGKRYDGHPDIDHVDIRSLGHWGEWHFYFVYLTHDREVDVASEVRQALVDMYLDAFEKTPLVMLIGGGDELEYAVANGTGWRADCLGDLSSGWNHMNDAYQQEIDAAGAGEAWKQAPVVFEACWTMQHWADEGWDIEFVFSEALRWHCSVFNNKSSPIPPRWWGAVEDFLRKMGYRLVLRSASHPARVAVGESLPLECQWDNIGVAPPYRGYVVAWQLRPMGRGGWGWGDPISIEDADHPVDVTTWLPGRRDVRLDLALPADIEPGRYRLALALLDPFTREPAVRLAIEGRDAQGWYSLSEVEVVSPEAE
jgi:hypothetical protein